MAAKKNPGQRIAMRYPPYLLARQIAALKRLSDDTETPVQYHIRQAIDEYLERRKKTKRGRSQCTWLLTEIDADGLTFGLCDLGLGCPELGYVSLLELRTVRGKLGLPVERDLHFEADRPTSAYADDARTHGRIVT